MSSLASRFFLSALSACNVFASAHWAPRSPNSTHSLNPLSNAKTSLTLLYQNNLNYSDDNNHRGAILLDPMTQQDGALACSHIGESLVASETLNNYSSDFYYSLSYLQYSGVAQARQRYFIRDAIVSIDIRSRNGLNFFTERDGQQKLPILCTQSSIQSRVGSQVAKASNKLYVDPGDNTYIGFRNQKSFRFEGIPYANPTGRWEYSTVYNQTGQTIEATAYGSDCPQPLQPSDATNCLFLNIQTPYIPRSGTTSRLRPVLFSIHGGAFVVGSGGVMSMEDGGNLASREDIVSVEINYRLSTLGFLAIPGTDIRGNYGIGDQITALRWVRENIAQYGGDPERITITGESAGAASVRALLSSPIVLQERLIVGAVMQSNLGGGVTLGKASDYGTSYSSYYTIEESYAVAGQEIFREAGCNQTTLAAQIGCLKSVPAKALVDLPTTAHFIVQDGTFVNTEHLILSTHNGSTAHVPVIAGTTLNDAASFVPFPNNSITSEAVGLQDSLDISPYYAQSIISSGLFPFYNTGNLSLDSFNVSQHVSTDANFRCIDEATVYAGFRSGVFPATYYYTFDRTYAGYDPNNLGTSGLDGTRRAFHYPNGDPSLPYFRLHAGELGFTYGNQVPLRDERDLLASQLISGYFASFVRTGNPNPDEEYLRVRGYFDQLRQVQESGKWEAVSGETGPSKVLDWVSPTVEFPDMAQCRFLNYSIGYYLAGGR